jgi:hypothetical protein
MMKWDPEALAARIEVLEEAVRALQRSNTELHNRIELPLNPGGKFSRKCTDYLWFFYDNKKYRIYLNSAIQII